MKKIFNLALVFLVLITMVGCSQEKNYKKNIYYYLSKNLTTEVDSNGNFIWKECIYVFDINKDSFDKTGNHQSYAATYVNDVLTMYTLSANDAINKFRNTSAKYEVYQFGNTLVPESYGGDRSQTVMFNGYIDSGRLFFQNTWGSNTTTSYVEYKFVTEKYAKTHGIDIIMIK